MHDGHSGSLRYLYKIVLVDLINQATPFVLELELPASGLHVTGSKLLVTVAHLYTKLACHLFGL